MLLDVTLQVGLLAEGAVAQAAAVGLLLVVDVPHVALQVGRDAEGALAELAPVGLLARVGAEVPREVGGAGEHLAAELARVPVLGVRRGGSGELSEGTEHPIERALEVEGVLEVLQVEGPGGCHGRGGLGEERR